MILCLWSPLHPLSKLLEIEDHTQNLEEQLWLGGRREVSIISHSPVTRSDLRHERSFFHGSVSTFLQLVAAINTSTYKYVTFWGSIFLSFCIIKLKVMRINSVKIYDFSVRLMSVSDCYCVLYPFPFRFFFLFLFLFQSPGSWFSRRPFKAVAVQRLSNFSVAVFSIHAIIFIQ